MPDRKITIVKTMPDKSMPDGLYVVIDGNKMYWGSYCVSTTWTGEKAIQVAWGDDLVACHRVQKGAS